MSFATGSLPPLGAPPLRPLVRSPKGLATALTVLLGLCAATRLLAVAAGLNRYLELDALGAGPLLGAGPGWGPYSGSVSLVLLAMAPTAVVFIVWFHRVRVNAAVWAPGTFRRGAGWAIGVWFIPAVGWTVLPFLIAMKVWVASASRLPGSAASPVSALPVTAWAGGIGAAMVVSLSGNRLAAAATTADGMAGATLVAMAADLLFAVAAGLAVVFVRRLSAMQSGA
ncbi:DUF4328 domain-containing protein [Streptomyces sp. NBC_00190]|uniref:DUF4328 domain-containing protein n=1 Tax=unclassified Streptomyces TaxID=2593676 RepID=UPI002E29D527|nr:DUF4328 domain-containing protein [Streptomyces sp. NBC_00190]WSZ43639.1 DUF4328 domain-containing protein [Streptomyces sp. NBC_00868]